MLKKIRIIFSLMEQADKRRLLFIQCLSTVNGLISVAGIASILPFIGVISEPDLIESNSYIQAFKQATGITSYHGIVLTFGSFSFILVLLGNLIDGLDAWFATRFGFYKEKQLSERLLSNYLMADDQAFRAQKNSQRTKNILADIDRVLLDSLFSFLDMLSNSFVTLIIFILLLLVDLQATLVISTAIVMVYLGVYFLTSKRLDRLGKEFASLETEIYSRVLEPLNLQREIKLGQHQKYFVAKYTRAYAVMIKNRLKFELISLIPQRVIEVVAYGSILLIAVYFALVENSNYTAITMIGMYAFATYRLMPAVSDIFDNYEQVQFSSAILEQLVKEFTQNKKAQNEASSLAVFNNKLLLKDLDFKFTQDTNYLFQNLNIEIKAGKIYCLSGSNACGKSTLLNIISGLYQPQNNCIYLDKTATNLYQNKSWQANLGYVCSDVQIIEASLAENIALGKHPEEIDEKRIAELIHLVMLETNLPELSHGYNTLLGEGELSLSQGQVQKIGIARALYSSPQILLMDEATDSLDSATEKFLLDNLKKQKGLTVIIASHRASIHAFADFTIALESIKKGQKC